MKPEIQLYSGEYFNYTKPEDGPYLITDIAHALANICRYTGHVSTFYSVAQHCVLVSEHCPPHLALAGLLHDAAEAYIGDVNSPLKSILPQYQEIESKIERALFEWFGVPFEHLAQIKEVDLRALNTERKLLMPRADESYWAGMEAYPTFAANIQPWSPAVAESRFLQQYIALSRTSSE